MAEDARRQVAPYRVATGYIAAACARFGFDLAQPLQVGWYNESVTAPWRLPDFGRPSTLAVVIGNSRALWPRLQEALDRDARGAAAPDPVDRYCETSIRAALAGVDQAWEARFAHELPPRQVAMQRLAHVAGLAYLTPSYLNVHPVYGPWIALRAAVVVDVQGPPGPAPRLEPPCHCDGHCLPLFHRAVAATVPVTNAAQTPSEAPAKAGGALTRDDMSAQWRAWLAVRDACPVGRDHRYSDDQIRYHYTLDRRYLRRQGQRDCYRPSKSEEI